MNPKFIKALKNPYYACELILNQFARFIDDESYVRWKYFLNFRKKLNLNNPKTYNEKLQWLKINDKHEEYTMMVDKWEAKKYVASIIGEDHLIPTIGVYDSFDEIVFNELPNQFVMKCTHNSGGIFICKDKSSFDINRAKCQINKWLKKNPYWKNREYPYKNVKPRIIIEQYMEDESGYELKDYKFFCFNGKVKCLFVASDRGRKGEETKFDFLDLDWNLLPFTNGHPNSKKEIIKPDNFDEMIKISEALSKGIPHVRVDLYNINGKIYFGELTFFHWSGLTPFVPDKWDSVFGSWLELPSVEKKIIN